MYKNLQEIILLIIIIGIIINKKVHYREYFILYVMYFFNELIHKKVNSISKVYLVKNKKIKYF